MVEFHQSKMAIDFEKTPAQKAEHVGINFGTDSLYARAMRLLARFAGENPSEERLDQALSIVERQVEEYLESHKPQP